MFETISIGDTMQDVFLEMTPENAHLHEIRHECEQICFNYADKIPVTSKHDIVGGNSSNSAVAFARLGFKAGIYTHVGGDDQGQRIIKEYRKNGVADDYIVVDHDKESNYSVVINLNAERTILIYHIHRHYLLPKMQPAKWVYLSSMGEGFENILPDLVHYVKENKVNLCYQPGTFQLKYGSERVADLLEHTKIFFVNKEEAELYLGKQPTDNFRELLDGLLALGMEIAVITDGPKGAYVSDGREYLYLGIIEEAPRIEATGAGDSFASGFTAASALGLPISEAMRWGQAEASSVIQQIGPQAGLLYRKQLDQILADNPDLRTYPLNAHGQPEK
ncbi:carbohydrate kinase family protein [Patescibacteria group bacterium]|nr:carbohydrate kinase family protein [Patescibacteria group bacterium]